MNKCTDEAERREISQLRWSMSASRIGRARCCGNFVSRHYCDVMENVFRVPHSTVFFLSWPACMLRLLSSELRCMNWHCLIR